MISCSCRSSIAFFEVALIPKHVPPAGLQLRHSSVAVLASCQTALPWSALVLSHNRRSISYRDNLQIHLKTAVFCDDCTVLRSLVSVLHLNTSCLGGPALEKKNVLATRAHPRTPARARVCLFGIKEGHKKSTSCFAC